MTPSNTKKTHGSQQCPPLWRGLKQEPKISFSRFSREICTFEKNVKSYKMFYVKFSTKMILMKLFVAIVLTKLQRFESEANVKKTQYATGQDTV